ncbi:hypothetical protein CTI12_AA530190 [Artemisia annua]|uniref:Uncharacterized protein n=1 Tax=Artemisia annua TaxID=35608 RepID=A0A2U1L3X8_ARTAN|nr:hypothetical protein CTI12_AA530190 [Artemisia annua]
MMMVHKRYRLILTRLDQPRHQQILKNHPTNANASDGFLICGNVNKHLKTTNFIRQVLFSLFRVLQSKLTANNKQVIKHEYVDVG